MTSILTPLRTISRTARLRDLLDHTDTGWDFVKAYAGGHTGALALPAHNYRQLGEDFADAVLDFGWDGIDLDGIPAEILARWELRRA